MGGCLNRHEVSLAACWEKGGRLNSYLVILQSINQSREREQWIPSRCPKIYYAIYASGVGRRIYRSFEILDVKKSWG